VPSACIGAILASAWRWRREPGNLLAVHARLYVNARIWSAVAGPAAAPSSSLPAPDAIADLDAGRVRGRAILVP